MRGVAGNGYSYRDRRSEADVAEVTETAKPAAQNDVGPLQSAGE
ncbi:hypothetical protein [Photorhabdus temperata]|nr:hypothetical protein [Photorhabdus temperata]